MAKQSTQHKLDRVRSPRVQITYDVEVGGAIELKELPFVMGVMGDFTGQRTASSSTSTRIISTPCWRA
jgi:type VI secretion system protein ImpB